MLQSTTLLLVNCHRWWVCLRRTDSICAYFIIMCCMAYNFSEATLLPETVANEKFTGVIRFTETSQNLNDYLHLWRSFRGEIATIQRSSTEEEEMILMKACYWDEQNRARALLATATNHINENKTWITWTRCRFLPFVFIHFQWMCCWILDPDWSEVFSVTAALQVVRLQIMGLYYC